MKSVSTLTVAVVLMACAIEPSVVRAQSPASASQKPAAAGPQTTAPAVVPPDYVIGPDDMLSVVFSIAKEMSHEVLVRPDGKISLPLINDVHAAGLTPLQLAEVIKTAGAKFVRDSNATVIVTQIRSRKVYVVGEVTKPGPFFLSGDMTVLQAIGEAGGFLEAANKSDVTIVRVEKIGEKTGERRFKFNYNDVVKGKNLQQNIKLQPGDTILVR